MATVYLGIGSNIGDKRSNLEEAVRRVGEVPSTRVEKSSEFYGTLPVGGPPQAPYLNGVLKVSTLLPPETFLDEVKRLEKDMGRQPSEGKDHPRVIDLDILLYDDLVLNTEKLSVPHPRMQERAFVLRGLAEIAPGAVHPVSGRTAEELYKEAV